MSGAPAPLLDVRDLSKSFGGVRALGRVSLTVDRGEVVGVIGPNGAGKTTLFNVLCGLAPNGGQIVFKGEDVTGLASHQICHRGIARTFQLTRPFVELSILDNVAAAVLFGQRHDGAMSLREARDRAGAILTEVKLDRRPASLAGDLLFAERRRLELARAVATAPELLLLDEVMAGLTVAEAQDMVEILEKLRRERQLTLLVIEHVMKVVMAICDRIVVLNYGEKLCEGRPAEVAAHQAVIDAYLGTERAGG